MVDTMTSPLDTAHSTLSGPGTFIPGKQVRLATQSSVLLVGHAAGVYLWGSERSLLDVLDGLVALPMNVAVVMPPGVTQSPAYLAALCERAFVVRVEDIPLRSVGQPPEEAAVARFCEIIRWDRIDAVHVNTTSIRTPLLAARRCHIPAVLHAREIPQDDPALCAWLGGDAEAVVKEILSDADFVIANSRATANALPLSGRTFVVPNIIDTERFPVRSELPAGPVRVVLAASLTERKGIEDFLRMAERLQGVTNARFFVVGAPTPLSARLQHEGVPANFEFTGYLATPEEIMARADVVVNMSRFSESFGRTLLEAMAAGLPVVAFDHGGPSEIVVHDRTGFLIRPGDQNAFAEAVVRLCREPETRQRLGREGRQRVETLFSPSRLRRVLRETYRCILPPRSVLAQASRDIHIPLPTENRTSFREAFFVGCRARFAHCTDVAFLDDRTLVTASLLGRRAYVVQFDPDAGKGKIVSETATEGLAGEASIDLLDIDDAHRIVMSDCEQQTVSLYRIESNVLQKIKTVRVPAGGFCHGVCFVPGDPDLVAVSVTTGNAGLHLVSLSTEQIVLSVQLSGWRPKAAAFFARQSVLVAWTRENVNQDPGNHHESRLTEIEISGNPPAARICADEILEKRSVDCVRIHDGRIFETDQIDDSINEWAIERGRFKLVRNYAGFSFPHGASVSPDGRWLAVAEYGTNSVVLRHR